MELGTVSAFVLIITPLVDKHVLENKALSDMNVRQVIAKFFILKA